MIMVDSHCHLFYKEIRSSLENKLKAAKLVGVKYALSVSTNSDDIEGNLQIANEHDGVFASVGIHPSSADTQIDLGEIEKYLDHEKVIAIGEVGLDYFYPTPSKDKQRSLLVSMLSLKNKTDLPYIIHARDCYPEILEIIKDAGVSGGVFHCYTDTVENAKKILDMGFYISISGIVTFKNATTIQEVAKYVPMDRLLIETDAPYLAPVPFRGKTNEPAYVSIVAEEIAKLRNETLETVAESTTENFFNLFKKARRESV